MLKNSVSTSSSYLPKELRGAAKLARLLDAQWRVPVLGWRFGIDALLGLIPVVGDAVGLFLSLSIVVTIANNKVPKRLVVRMVGNVVLDFLIGCIPVVGDVIDVFYCANHRNIGLLEEHFMALHSFDTISPLP